MRQEKPVSKQEQPRLDGQEIVKKIFTGNAMVSFLAVFLALVLGGLLIAATDKDVATTAGYLFARPTDFLSALWKAATNSYVALFQG
ncbi:MAG: ABC transporter permease, partial [Arthrobacter sp.]|nr:ABC transporter permease [Arthrobacter sp.]